MLNIGKLDLRFQLYSASSSENSYGEVVDTMSGGVYLYARRVYKRYDIVIDGGSLHGKSDLELIVRFNDSIKLSSKLKGPIFSTDSAASIYYIVNGIEELGRREGMKLYLTRLIEQEDN
tara:strand:- start:109 stop:465 length:357 start_codon:yes stop_codon:yes gene_type:complete